MTLINSLHRYTGLLLGIFLLCSFAAHADDMQDAGSLFKQGDYANALTKVNSFLAKSPKDAQARFLKGLILTEQGKSTEAINTFTSLSEDFPELPEPYNNLAVLYAGLGNYDKAKIALEMAIRTHPSYATAHENLGDIYAKMASQAYDRALQLDRGNATTQTKLAMIQDLFADNKTNKPAPTRGKVASNARPPAPTPVKATTPPDSAKNKSMTPMTDEVMQMVNAWAAAWSAQDVAQYLSFYAADFNPGGGQSRAAWQELREKRVSTPEFINVAVNNYSVNFADENHATVEFRQTYRASHLNVSSNKTLLLVKSNGKWLIREELSN